jgi:cation diffusion facilitator family transporter
MRPNTDLIRRGIRSAQLGALVNAGLALVKLLAGIVGHSYALVADGIESAADIFSSLIVWGGLHLAGRDPDEDYPFGYGKAESLAAAVVSIMLLGAALVIAVAAIREIHTPHHAPAPWTLIVLVTVVVIKWILSRRVRAVGAEVRSTAVQADAWHHLSDAITSTAAFIGISIALLGGPGWEAADDWAALAAAAVIGYNGIAMLRPALSDLMDRMPGSEIVEAVAVAARGVSGVLDVEKLMVRKAGLVFYVDIHVQADPAMPLEAAHILSGRVKSAIRRELPEVAGVLVHMEPYLPKAGEGGAPADPGKRAG